MTAQVMDTIRIDDQEWQLCEWQGPNVTPSSASLGFETEEESTANYSGRVDHFVVDKGKLLLSHVDANLTAASRDFVPDGGAREDITRRAWVEELTGGVGDFLSGGRGKWTPKLSTDSRVVLHFRDLRVPFTGRIVGGRAFDQKEYVHMGTQAASSFRSRLLLDFRDSVLVARAFENANAPEEPADEDAFDEETQSD